MSHLVMFVYFCLLGAIAASPEEIALKASAVGWPEANRIFHTDYRWKGSDAAYSIDLGHGRVLWLFGDAFIAYKKPYLRRNDCMAFIRNCVAIQNGYDPIVATMEYFWGHRGKKPASFFPDHDTIWYWPLDGLMIDGRLLLFLSKVGRVETGLGFEARGHAGKIIENPEENPDKWIMRSVRTPGAPWCETFGSAVETFADSLYAFCCNWDHTISLARWPLDSARTGALDNPEWWCGDSTGWVEHQSLNGHTIATLFGNGMTEFSVWRDTLTEEFLLVQTEGFGQARLVLRRANSLVGPWSTPELIYDPPENVIPHIMIYAAKAHPHLQVEGMALTYATNGFEKSVLEDSSICYPRFVRLTLQSVSPDSLMK